MKCSDCGYYWKEEWEDYPCCHYPDIPWPVPCEIEGTYDDVEDCWHYDGDDDDSWDNDD